MIKISLKVTSAPGYPDNSNSPQLELFFVSLQTFYCIMLNDISSDQSFVDKLKRFIFRVSRVSLRRTKKKEGLSRSLFSHSTRGQHNLSTICLLLNQLYFNFSKCSGFTLCFFCSGISLSVLSMYIDKSRARGGGGYCHIECFHSRGQHLCKFIGTKEIVLHKKRVQLPEDWFGTPTWPPFHCFGTPTWPP